MVNTHIDYANSVWSGISQAELAKLRRLQNTLARVVLTIIVNKGATTGGSGGPDPPTSRVTPPPTFETVSFWGVRFGGSVTRGVGTIT